MPKIEFTRIIWQNDYIQITEDKEEPWRCYVHTDPERDGNFSHWAGNPRLTEMADMALALLTEYRAQAR
jgi:hypothetical protein